MGNGERSGSGGRGDWPVRLATAIGVGIGGAIALLWKPEFFSGSLWLGLLGYGLFCAVGGILGRLVGGMLFRSPSSGPSGEKTGNS